MREESWQIRDSLDCVVVLTLLFNQLCLVHWLAWLFMAVSKSSHSPSSSLARQTDRHDKWQGNNQICFKSIWGLTNAAFQVRVIENCSRCIILALAETRTMKTRRQWSFIIYTVQIFFFLCGNEHERNSSLLQYCLEIYWIYIYIYILKIWRGERERSNAKASKCHLGQKWHATDTDWMLSTHCICSSSFLHLRSAKIPASNPFRSISTYIETYACSQKEC